MSPSKENFIKNAILEILNFVDVESMMHQWILELLGCISFTFDLDCLGRFQLKLPLL